jgi:N-acylneuraminate cytidylyltransferase
LKKNEFEILVVIPARAGSKRLPGKNIKNFNGKPLIYYSIDYALKSFQNADIVVSSDGDEILKISKDLGAIPVERPKDLSGDYATTTSALIHALEVSESRFRKKYKYVVTLQVTNPIRPLELGEMMLKAIEKDLSADSIVSISLLKEKFGKLVNGEYIPENYKFNQRSQDLNPLYFENGLIYISKSEAIKKGNMFGDRVLGYQCSNDIPLVDIDEQVDFEIAEVLYKKYFQRDE